MEETQNKPLCVLVKWNGQEFRIDDVNVNGSVLDLKKQIQYATGVLTHRQKLLNVKHKGKMATDECLVSELGFKNNFKIMMMGSLEEQIAQANCAPEENDDVINDFDLPEEVLLVNNQIFKNKIEKRIKEYKIEILNEPRENKKLVVLDIDYTVFDHRSTAQNAAELMRPHLHEFLTAAYEYYDIIFWSATSMKWIVEKLKMLGVSTNPSYKICCYVDGGAMISVETERKRIVDVKPLAVIWAKFPQYNASNTIMFDDISHNFLMNPQSGLRIRPFRLAHFNRDKDKELIYLRKYLISIAKRGYDFTKLNHNNYRIYLSKRKHHKDRQSVNSSETPSTSDKSSQ